jgi:hypothetical protein
MVHPVIASKTWKNILNVMVAVKKMNNTLRGDVVLSSTLTGFDTVAREMKAVAATNVRCEER